MTEIIHRGTLTLEKLKELSKIHLSQKPEYKKEIELMEAQANTPTDDSFTVTKQKDGNWKGATKKNGKTIEIRDIDPNTVLTRLLTHE